MRKIINNVIETLEGRNSINTNALEAMKVVEIIESIYAYKQPTFDYKQTL